MSLTVLMSLLTFTGGLFAGLFVGAYMVFRDHGDLIDDGLRWRNYVNDLALRHSSQPVLPAAEPGVRGEARAWFPVVIDGGAL